MTSSPDTINRDPRWATTSGIADCGWILVLLLAKAGDSLLNLIAAVGTDVPAPSTIGSGIVHRLAWQHSRVNQPVVLSVIRHQPHSPRREWRDITTPWSATSFDQGH